MRKLKYTIGCLFGLMLFLTSSCSRDWLDKTPDEDLNMDQVFSNRKYTESFLTSAYSSLSTEDFNDDSDKAPFCGASDEMEITWTYPFSQLMNSGGWNPSNVIGNTWSDPYLAIRKVNLFLENVAKAPITTDDLNRWTGEATFLRAFYHFWVLRLYGPIPIMNHSLSTDADFKSYKRNTLDDCVKFIVADCDKAASLLPITVSSDLYGRATKAAALALKSRCLLYAASPLWNGNSDYSSFADKSGVLLFPSSYDASKWQKAADAAKACIDACETAGYKLYRDPSNDPELNYQQLFLVRNNSEILFAKNLGVYDHVERCTTPTGLGGWSGYAPTQEQVDAYEMNNGLSITDPNSGYVENGFTNTNDPKGYYFSRARMMYVNREPRFYASINYNGQHWRNHTIEFFLKGSDGRGKGGPDFSITGYTMRKTSDPTINIPEGKFTLKTYIYFRLGEQYLNYAEALNEAQGPVSDVYKYVNAIRDRAGLPGLPAGLDKDGMREKIRHERRVELAFETHRYFDCHRWKIAETTDNGYIHGMNINQGLNMQDETFWQRIAIEKRIFEKKHYLWPIPQGEIDKNPNLIQNPGW